MAATLLHGDSAVLLRDLPDNSVDAVVTDPPASMKFIGREGPEVMMVIG